MWEGGFVSYELTKEEYNLLCETFANEACSWVACEVRKVLGDDIEQFGSYPGCSFHLLLPKTLSFPTRVIINPVSEQEVSVWCLHTGKRESNDSNRNCKLHYKSVRKIIIKETDIADSIAIGYVFM